MSFETFAAHNSKSTRAPAFLNHYSIPCEQSRNDPVHWDVEAQAVVFELGR